MPPRRHDGGICVILGLSEEPPPSETGKQKVCENCGSETVLPVCIDDNYETELCRKCIRLVRAVSDVKVMNPNR